jgi:HSP20 family molecular chaperone IbpA
VERLSQVKVFVPQTDIYETPEAFHVLANMPGVDVADLDVTLEKNVLTLRGHGVAPIPDSLTLANHEYDTGDFERTFTLSDEIDDDSIAATVCNGVVDITLPKAKDAEIKKITITGA